MDPITMFALAQGIPAVAQGITGAFQMRQSRKMLKDLKRPEMEIPDSAVAALSKAKSIGSSFDMPGQDQAEQLLDQQVAGAASNIQETASSPAEALAALSNVYANRMTSQTELAGQAAQSYMQRQQNVQAELNRMADWEQKQFEVNEMQPFMDTSAAASALGAGGMQNMYEGIKGVSGAIGGAYMNKQLIDQLSGGSTGMMGALNSPNQPTFNATPDVNAALEMLANSADVDLATLQAAINSAKYFGG
jgi:hypothetical protein